MVSISFGEMIPYLYLMMEKNEDEDQDEDEEEMIPYLYLMMEKNEDEDEMIPYLYLMILGHFDHQLKPIRCKKYKKQRRKTSAYPAFNLLFIISNVCNISFLIDLLKY